MLPTKIKDGNMYIYLDEKGQRYFTVPNQDQLADLFKEIRTTKKELAKLPHGRYSLAVKLQSLWREANGLLNTNKKMIKLVSEKPKIVDLVIINRQLVTIKPNNVN